jgi:hypothetical protein
MDVDRYDWVRVLPGSPHIRLWFDALASTGRDPDSVRRVRSGIDKFNVNTTNIATEEYPLNRLYLLNAGEQLSIQIMSPSEAFLSVIPHLYVCRFGNAFLQAIGAVHAFQQMHKVLQQITVKRLCRQRDLNQLTDVTQLIEADVHRE